MYLKAGFQVMPLLDIKLDEPKLFSHWMNNFPVQAMNEVYGLSPELGNSWKDHAYIHVLEPVESGNNPRVHSVERMNLNWDAWIASGADASLFVNTKLERIASYGMIGALLLLPDVECEECDSEEPAWIFRGQDDVSTGWHARYKPVKEALKYPLFDAFTGFPGCHICRPNDYPATPSMRRYARRRVEQCTCMPCRGRL